MIRVLDIHKTRFKHLECSISEINLKDGGYQALSYEWGDPEQPFRILVRGTKHKALGYIPLTKNIFDALRDLRDCSDIESKRFWIDQICINQEDEEEKGHQVELMASVYRDASRVITYLGPQSRNVEREQGALELLERITVLFRPHFIEIARTIPNLAITNPRLAPLVINKGDTRLDLDNPYWIDLLHIVYSGWTHRLWMVQENILCQNTLMLRGQCLLNWISVGSIPVLFSINLLPKNLLGAVWPSLGLNIDSDSMNHAITHPWRLRMDNDHDGLKTLTANSLTLGYNIFLFSTFQCKDPRDRVYAMLGISEDSEELGIVPDYQSPESQVLIATSMRIHFHYQNLRLLSNLSALENSTDPSMPSWAYRTVPESEDFVPPFQPHPWDQGNIRFEAQNSIMVIKGRIVDRIKIRSPPQTFRITSSDEMLRQTLVDFAIILESLGVNLRTVASFFHVFMCDKSWRLFENENDDDVEVTFYFWCWYMTWVNKFMIPSKIGDEQSLPTQVLLVLKLMCELLRTEGRDVPDNPCGVIDRRYKKIALEVSARDRSGGRSFCVSEQNRFCNTTGKVRTGDAIALFAGGEHAYLLRPAGDNYQYVGTAWIEDLADCALYKDVSPEEVDYEIRLV
jgi:hypothetical protein